MVKSGVELLLQSSGVTLALGTNGRDLLCNNHAEIAEAAVSFSIFFHLFSLCYLSSSNAIPPKPKCFTFAFQIQIFLIEVRAVGTRSI